MVSLQFCINPIQPVQTIKISPTKKKEKEDFVPPSFAAPLLLLVVPVEVGVANQIGVSPSFIIFNCPCCHLGILALFCSFPHPPPPRPSYNHCTPLNMQTAFDILLADAFMCVFWVVGELLIKSFDLELKDEIDGGKAFQKRMDAAEKAQHMVLPEDRRKNVRHSPEWNEQIKGWKERQKLQKKVAGLNNWARAYGFYFFFWVLFVLSQYLVCITAPKVKSYSRQYGMPIYYVTLFRQMLSPSFAGPYDYIIWSVVFLEAVLFFMAAAVVTWPKPPLIRGVESNANTDFYKQSGIGTDNLLKVKPRDFFKKGTGIVQLLEDEHGGLIQDTCLLIACHMSTLTPERTHTFSATVKSALRVFPAHAIFVCDNGPWQHPLDRTDKVCTQISRDHDPSGQTNINYLYIPEGNKSHAMYWATEYWIPELVRRYVSACWLYSCDDRRRCGVVVVVSLLWCRRC